MTAWYDIVEPHQDIKCMPKNNLSKSVAIKFVTFVYL